MRIVRLGGGKGDNLYTSKREGAVEKGRPEREKASGRSRDWGESRSARVSPANGGGRGSERLRTIVELRERSRIQPVTEAETVLGWRAAEIDDYAGEEKSDDREDLEGGHPESRGVSRVLLGLLVTSSCPSSSPELL